jgi:hypothetical protein
MMLPELIWSGGQKFRWYFVFIHYFHRKKNLKNGFIVLTQKNCS